MCLISGLVENQHGGVEIRMKARDEDVTIYSMEYVTKCQWGSPKLGPMVLLNVKGNISRSWHEHSLTTTFLII